MAKIGLPKGSGKPLRVRERSLQSQGILKRILSGNPVNRGAFAVPYGCLIYVTKRNECLFFSVDF